MQYQLVCFDLSNTSAGNVKRSLEQRRPSDRIVRICGHNMEKSLVKHTLGPVACSPAELPDQCGRRELH